MFGSSIKRAVAGAALALGAVTAFASPASAQRLNVTGSVDVSESGPGGINVLFDFLNPVLAVPTVSGFAGVTPLVTTGSMTDFEVGPGGCVGCPISVLSIGGYTFTLFATPAAPAGPFNYGPVQLVQSATGTTATLGVNGTVTGGIYNNTAFTGLFTAQFTGESPADVFASVEAGGTRNVGFSAEFAVVPEPSTYALMAFGLAGVLVVSRRRRTT